MARSRARAALFTSVSLLHVFRAGWATDFPLEFLQSSHADDLSGDNSLAALHSETADSEDSFLLRPSEVQCGPDSSLTPADPSAPFLPSSPAYIVISTCSE